MEVRLSPECERYVRRVVESGAYASASDAVAAGLRILEVRSASSPLKGAVALGLEQALAGRSVPVTAEDVIRRSHRRGKRR